MKEHDSGKLSDQALLEGSGEICEEDRSPQYKIGDIIYSRENPGCFGRIIKQYLKNGKWVYQIMGSDTIPRNIEESDAALK